MTDRRRIAYFSMEIGLEVGMPTYSGGLGVLAGDTVRAAADLHVPMAAVTLLYRKGYFRQRLDPEGRQKEEPVDWVVGNFLKQIPQKVSVTLEGRTVALSAWKYEAKAADGFVVPVYFLDSDCPENSQEDRKWTHLLYGGDSRYRLCQEIILGVGGVRLLRALGLTEADCFHMNEGHAVFLTLELLNEQMKKAGRQSFGSAEMERVRAQCVFTTHTPVPAGHDKFPMDLVKEVFGSHPLFEMKDGFFPGDLLNTTTLALHLSRFVNGVSKMHAEVSQKMFPEYKIHSITNGVHAATWTCRPFQELFEKYVPGWKQENSTLQFALRIPATEIWQAHQAAKRALLEYVTHHTLAEMELNTLTVVFARRFVAYKRPDLLLRDLEQIKQIAHEVGPIQILYAGKAHPHDEDGKKLLQKVIQTGRQMRDSIRFAYLEDYDLELGKLLCAGADLWINTPQAPMEASGTSGMKAALNGVPSLSVLDGWWAEGHVEGVTGWVIAADGEQGNGTDQETKDAEALYKKLREASLLYYRHPSRFADVMKHAIALNGAVFNAQRMMQQYLLQAYNREKESIDASQT